MNFLVEANMHDVINRIDSVFDVVSNRLLPTFHSIEEEADDIEKQTLEKLSHNFNPDYMDEASVYDDAYHAGVHHYHLQTEMKNEFIKTALTWLFHLFEKDCTHIFNTECGNQKKSILEEYDIDTSKGSDWYKCNKEMRVLANAIKHGLGASHTQAESLRPDLFKERTAFFSNSRIYIPEDELQFYKNSMRKFWVDFFEKWWEKNMDGTLRLP